MTLYSIIHGPEVWLMIAQIAVGLGIFDLGLLVGMHLAAILAANGRDDDEHQDNL